MSRLPTYLVAAVALAASLGCRGTTSTEPPVVPIRNMHQQQRFDPQEETSFFADGRTMRVPVEGTIPRERVLDPELGEGRLPDDSGYVLEIPAPAVTNAGGMDKLLERGEQRFNIYCRPCHDGTGSGQGMVITRAKWQPAPPTFHQDRIRQMPDGQLFATISNGVRLMPAYGPQIPVQDRWAIVSYVRALQLSQGE
jgi:mono/diheme cytochrome c family protein